MDIKNKKTIPHRLPLRGWAVLEDVRRKIDHEAEWGRWSLIPDLIFQSINICTEKDTDHQDSFWLDVVELYNKAIEANSPRKVLPILTSKEKSKPMPWEYEGRTWYFWLNLFAKSYGWDAEKIGALDIDDAIALYQETVIDEQLENEWDWGLSEISYEYVPSTKKSKFRPLPRPSWMLGVAPQAKKPEKKIKILKKMLPQGNVVSLD